MIIFHYYPCKQCKIFFLMLLLRFNLVRRQKTTAKAIELHLQNKCCKLTKSRAYGELISHGQFQ